MLRGMRKSAKQILWPLIIALVITLGGYGVWNLVRPEEGESKVAVIRGEEVKLEEFSQAYQAARVIASLERQQPTQKQLFTIVWRRLILKREAEKMGVTATRRELARFLARWPIFQVEGRFNPQRYNQVLNQLRIEGTTFEEQVRAILAIEKMRMIIQSQALVSHVEVAETYQRLSERIKVEYVQITREPFSDLIDLPEEELDEYYRQNQSQFQVQTQIEITYFLLPFERFEENVTVEPEEIEERYREQYASFADQSGDPPGLEDLEEEIKAELTEEKVRKAAAAQADTINKMLDNCTTLDQPAKEFSLSLRKSGYFTADGPIPELGEIPKINQLAFTMDIKEKEIVSYPVSVPEGFIFFQVIGKKDASLLPFEEAREEILTILNDELTAEETLKVARDELAEMRELVMDEERDFDAAAEELDLKPVTTPFFTREGSDELPVSPVFVQAAFLTIPGRVSELIPTEEGYAFLTVLERAPAGPMPEEEQERWTDTTRRAKAMLVYDTWFNNLVRESKFSITNKELAP